jgi:hypothetical protein
MAEEKRRSGLGRGIGSLIPSGEREAVDVFFSSENEGLTAVPGAKLAYLDPNRITPNPQQPRANFEPEAFAELVHSVREFGVLQPIVVRPKGSDFELIMGERRLRASKEAGLEAIPAVIRETADENMLRDALLENLHRANLNPLEEGKRLQAAPRGLRHHPRAAGRQTWSLEAADYKHAPPSQAADGCAEQGGIRSANRWARKSPPRSSK